MPGVVYTELQKCVGCNHCIRICSFQRANVAFLENGMNKVHVRPEFCITCGECVRVCAPKARLYYDDTQKFFSDIKAGKKISLIVDAAFKTNFPQYKKVLGWLKSLGIAVIFDAAFGGEITVWGYIKFMKENQRKFWVSSLCPVSTNNLEIWKVEIMENIIPVYSPMMATAKYMKKYANISDQLAFISPCMAKKEESNEFGEISYNVTFAKLNEYMQDNHINIDNFQEQKYDNPECSIGELCGNPGGLRENIELHTGRKILVKQVSGARELHDYEDSLWEKRNNPANVMPLIDILNCSQGCHGGTAGIKGVDFDDVDNRMNEVRASFSKHNSGFIKKNYDLFDKFDKELQLDDFICKYTMRNIKTPSTSGESYEEAYKSMLKFSEHERKIDCGGCGYLSCKRMAQAIVRGLNHPENCMYFMQKRLEQEKAIVEENSARTADVLQRVQEMSESREKLTRKLRESVKEIKNLLSELSIGSDQVSREVIKVSEKVAHIVSESQHLNTIVEEIKHMMSRYTDISDEIVNVAGQTNLLSLNASIEAARAGEAGKGFAVVAEEVRKLSEYTKHSAEQSNAVNEEIEPRLVMIVQIAEKFLQSTAEVGASLENVVASNEEIAAQTHEIANTAHRLVNEQ